MIPIIEIEWDYFKELDESYIDDLTPFGIILLVLIKGDDTKFFAYELDTQKWSILRE
jgi:hypothetical protein